MTSPSASRIALFYSDHAEILITPLAWDNERPLVGHVHGGGWCWNAKCPELADFIHWLPVPTGMSGDVAAVLAWATAQYESREDVQ